MSNETLTEPEDLRLSIEHGWVCVRIPTGRLVWSIKIEDVPETGAAFPFAANPGREPW